MTSRHALYKMFYMLTCILFIVISGSVMAEIQTKKAVLAGGCFWGVEKLFSEQEGVIDVVNGYTGGEGADPTYDIVKTGASGHAEAVEITYDPKKISYEAILKFFFQIHDPTTLNRQQNDIGSQYRSAIFYTDLEQKNTALNVIAEGNRSGVFDKPIVTTLEKLEKFYPAEDYHQDYLDKNPYGYTCHKVRDDWKF